MLRKRTDGQEGDGNVKTDKKKKASPGESKVSQHANETTCWSTLILMGKILLLIIFVPPFLNYAALQREGQMLSPKGGESFDIGLGQKIYMVCKGKGQPVVMLDAPTGMSSDIWHHVQESLSELTKVCTYDRVGLGFSRRVLQNETAGMEKVWGVSTTGRMVDDLHRLVKVAEIATPFILVGSELGSLNGRFYSHIHHTQVSDLVLIDPIPEDVFEEEQWQQYWYSQLVPSLQMLQFVAAAGLSRVLIILGLMKPALHDQHVSEELLQRQKYLLSNPAHQSGAVDEHFFLNESASQVREISKFKPLSSKTSVSVITGDTYDEQLPAHLNQVVAELQKRFVEQSYPQASRIHVPGADRRMLYTQPAAVSKHLWMLVSRRQSRKQSQ
ncbi:hypothetical protein AALO_G00174940 [Alosa alosa]|uniref:AB hydrolase-1 domain-containing protein n=1 Tax=Alosa alosa TaxID=278164 RepID=A0AAV6GBY5_9TELE|nr:uncharacterized protein si:dkey-122a22.2 isoform X1 [Alosa alosa]KAG5271017.1 hypothetical protein AALO_G00174940 [Alosa alosa]